jgi:hypothetical protein
MGPKTLPTIWGTYMKLVTKYQISAIPSFRPSVLPSVRPSVLPSIQDIFRRIFLSNCWWQKSDIWSKASYRYTILWEALSDPRFLPSIVVEENATKNGHIQNVCSMCIKINKVVKQEVGIWWVQKRFTILWEALSDPSDSYFLFADLVGFYTHWTYLHIFRHFFLSNYRWQRSDIWSQASYRYPISWEAFLDPSDSRKISWMDGSTEGRTDGRTEWRTDRRTDWQR